MALRLKDIFESSEAHDSGAFIGADAPYDDSSVAIVGVPYDATASYRKGASQAPSAIRGESGMAIETWSPYQRMDLADADVSDVGDIDVDGMSPSEMVDSVEAEVGSIMDDGKVPVIMGGEHLVTLGAVAASVKRHPDLHLIHFDAHADLRDEYDGESLSHATVIRRCHDILGDGRIWQFGVRSGSEDEFRFSEDGHTNMVKFGLGSDLDIRIPDGAPVYVTVDLDVLDPSEFPGTGTPEAGGVTFNDLQQRLIDILGGTNVVAIDNVELAPSLDGSGVSTALACKLMREELIALANIKVGRL